MVKTPKNLKKLDLSQKKKFVELFNMGALSPVYTSYLALNQAEITFYQDKIDELKKEITEHEAGKEEKRAAERIKAAEENEQAQRDGFVAAKEKVSKIKEWTVPQGKEREFFKDSTTRGEKYMLEKWCNNKKLIHSETERIEKLGF